MSILQVGFFGAFRASELVSLQFEDISFVPEGIDVLIPRFKTDPIGSGQSCAIPYGQGELCPVRALKIWCEKAEITEGAIFRGINSHGKLNTQFLSPQSISLIIKKVAIACQIPQANSSVCVEVLQRLRAEKAHRLFPLCGTVAGEMKVPY